MRTSHNQCYNIPFTSYHCLGVLPSLQLSERSIQIVQLNRILQAVYGLRVRLRYLKGYNLTERLERRSGIYSDNTIPS